MLIVLEGIDGCGKTTQCKLLQDALPGSILLNEYSTSATFHIKHNVLSNICPEPKTQVLLHAAARQYITEKVIKPRLQAGETVIMDRFIASGIVYGIFGLKLSPSFVHPLMPNIKPNLSILLDIDPVIAQNRLSSNFVADLYDHDTDLQHRVRDGFLNYFNYHKQYEPEKYIIINANIPINALHDKIYQHIFTDPSLIPTPK
jgi:dTMP kinase